MNIQKNRLIKHINQSLTEEPLLVERKAKVFSSARKTKRKKREGFYVGVFWPNFQIKWNY